MKISVTQENLATILNTVIKATAVKPNIPVLANILLKTEKNKLSFSATNLEISITGWIGADVAEEGELTVNARLLTEFVSQLQNNRIELISSGQSLVVKSVDNQAQLYVISATDFPTLPAAIGEADIVVNANEFKAAIDKTSFAAATDQSRPILTGLLLETTQRKLSLVGIDGFRLSKKIIRLEKGPITDLKIIIPSKSLLDLAKIITDLADDKDTVNIFLLKEKNQIIFKLKEITLSSRLLEGEFPDYKQIIPTEKVVNISINKAPFSNCVKIVNIFARNVLGNKTFFSILADSKKLQLSTKVMDMGNNETQAELNTITGENYETAYNAKYLTEMLNSISGDVVSFESNGTKAPGVFKDSADENYLHVIMPMRME